MYLINVVVFLIWCDNIFVVIIVLWIGLFYGEEVLVVMDLAGIIIGWVGFDWCVWFIIFVVILFVFYCGWNFDFSFFVVEGVF